ncbi:hypothetical protein Tco_0249524, partial [Tanacetum coccineum]
MKNKRKLAPKSSGGSGDVGNGNGVFGNLNEGDECLPLNTNVNVSDQPTLPVGVGGSKRRRIRQLDSAGPSQAM